MITLKWIIRNGEWTQVPMLLTKTATGWVETPAPLSQFIGGL